MYTDSLPGGHELCGQLPRRSGGGKLPQPQLQIVFFRYNHLSMTSTGEQSEAERAGDPPAPEGRARELPVGFMRV